MTQRKQKNSSWVREVDWGTYVPTKTSVAGDGIEWKWTGSGGCSIKITHSDGTNQVVTGGAKVVATRYDGVWDFEGE